MTQPIHLADGRAVVIRPIRADDADRLAAFHARLSPETVRRRYFTAHPRLSPDELHRFTNVDGDTRLALVAVDGDDLVGVGRYETLADGTSVEVAFVVRDDFQHLGLGGHLVEAVAAAAVRHGKERLVAETLPENRAMRLAMRHAGRTTSRFADGLVEIVVPLRGSPAPSPRP
jgi:GNAT superfamily N-acetyltransferase